MTYRILVTGGRDWTDTVYVSLALSKAIGLHRARDEAQRELLKGQVVVVHGDCPTGADAIAEAWCRRHDVKAERHPAAWDLPDGTRDKSAGPKRNTYMVSLGADVCLAFWDGSVGGSGTHDCFMKAVKAGIPVHIYPKAARR